MNLEAAIKSVVRRRKSELMVRYAYQFRELRKGGLHVPPGWLALFEQLCRQVDLALPDRERRAFYWTDVKERLGTLRASWAGHHSRLTFGPPGEVAFRGVVGSPTKEVIDALVRKAERASEQTCLLCGAPGKLRAGIGWASTTCEEHKDASFGFLSDL